MPGPTAPRHYERLFAVLALASALACMGGCTGTEEESLRFGIPSAPVTLDPRFATDAVSYRLCRLIYQSLVDFDDEIRPVPALARWRQITPVHYRFELKPDQSFHDGRRVTAGDVVATYRSVLDAETGSPHRGSLVNVAAVEQHSDLVVDFHLKNPDPLFPGLLVIGIVPGG